LKELSVIFQQASFYAAIRVDGVNVQGYCVWTLLDNFEWDSGFTPKFGVHYVDFEDENKTRYKKRSSDW